MEEPKLPAGEPKGESKVNEVSFENRESFVIKTKATDEELAKFDSVSLISYLIDLHSNRPNDRKRYEKQFLKDCSPHMEEVERHVQMAIRDFDIISKDNIIFSLGRFLGFLP